MWKNKRCNWKICWKSSWDFVTFGQKAKNDKLIGKQPSFLRKKVATLTANTAISVRYSFLILINSECPHDQWWHQMLVNQMKNYIGRSLFAKGWSHTTVKPVLLSCWHVYVGQFNFTPCEMLRDISRLVTDKILGSCAWKMIVPSKMKTNRKYLDFQLFNFSIAMTDNTSIIFAFPTKLCNFRRDK